ncbi:MAG: hypothetical protein COT84_05100 [Chlamydiae bacterium CG10_big_fil_rev_8_21_14_0_10_35_9]|nr:MAG: hypothetical protein COT84_05100 [Chlamydiae bacterium CG10_big_fil_rev_8_21_14_0_10_35_9]
MTVNSYQNTIQLPPDLVSIVFCYLNVAEQAIVRRVSSIWNEVPQSNLGKFAQINSIAILSIYALQILNQHSSNHLVKVQTAIQNTSAFLFPIVDRFNQQLDPSDKILSKYLSKVLKVKHISDPLDMIAFLRSFSLKARQTIQSLDFSSHSITDLQVCHLLWYCPKVSSLNLSMTRIIGNGFANVFENRCLKKLNLSWCENLHEDTIQAFFTQIVALEKLDLSHTYLTKVCLPKPNLLRTLYLNSCKNLPEKALLELLSQTSLLEELSLSQTHISKLPLPSPNLLKKLDLSQCPLNEEAIQECFLQAFAIEELDLSCTYITRIILPNPHLLKKLNLSGCQNLDMDALAELLSQTSSLEELDLSYTDVIRLPLKNPGSLKKLNLSGCKFLEEEAFLELLSKATSLKGLDLLHSNILEKNFQSINLFQNPKLLLSI